MAKKISGLLMILLLAGNFCFAETVVLKSGKRIKGKIVGETDKYIRIETGGAYQNYYFEDIARIEGKEDVPSLIERIFKPKDAEFYYKKGVKYAAEGNFEEAKKHFKKVQKTKLTDYKSKIYLELAVKWLTTLDDLDKGIINQEYALHFFKGADNIIAKNHKESIVEFEKAVQINPDYTEAYRGLGVAYRELGELRKALKYFKKVQQLNPDDGGVYTDIGNIYSALDDSHFKEAMYYYKKGIQLNPNKAKTYICLGNLYYRLGQVSKAKYYQQKAIAINPDEVDAYLNLGNIHAALGEAQEAIFSYKKFLELSPDNAAVAYMHLGLVYGSLLGDSHKEIKHLKKALKIDPDLDGAYVNLGIAYYQLGRHNEARKSFQKAKELYENKGDQHHVQKMEEYLSLVK